MDTAVKEPTVRILTFDAKGRLQELDLRVTELEFNRQPA